MIVQKYGGIAMQDQQSRQLIIKHIQKAMRNHEQVLVVVSAMGRRGQHYSTDTLLDLIPTTLSSVESDLLSACGELISASVLCAELKKGGINTTVLYGKRAGIITNEAYGNANIIDVNISILNSTFNEFPCIIVPGFQGISEKTHNFTTLGRGGSDFTAVVYGHHLKAEVVEFYKDVPGVMTSDPSKNKSVELIPVMSYEELQTIISTPVEIIQKRAAKFAALYKVPLHIRSLYEEQDGTFIFH